MDTYRGGEEDHLLAPATSEPPNKRWHRLSAVDEVERTAYCSLCSRRVRIQRRSATCSNRGQWRCGTPQEERRRERKARLQPWTVVKGDQCERCGFIPEVKAQLDVHHVDGNRRNNDQRNLQTLCSNCHRLITWQEQQPPL